MRWEELTSDAFAQAVRDSRGVCLVGLGVLERHGPHLPLGTDVIFGHYICQEAAKLEPAVVFPWWYFGQIYEARAFPGCFTLPPRLLMELLQAMLDEIGRNGFTKIVLLCAHGGNPPMARFLAQSQLHQAKPYQVYVVDVGCGLNEQERRQAEALLTVAQGGHADEGETSQMLVVRPDLVKMDTLGQQVAKPLGRGRAVANTFNGFGWYADYPEHYAGDARAASAEKGRALIELRAKALARIIQAVKADRILPGLAEEFFRRESQLRP